MRREIYRRQNGQSPNFNLIIVLSTFFPLLVFPLFFNERHLAHGGLYRAGPKTDDT